MKKTVLSIIVLMIFSLLFGCKSEEEKRRECIEEATNIVREWMDTYVDGETQAFIKNYNELISENKKKQPIKEFTHKKGLRSDTKGFVQQIQKDMKWIEEAENDNRYDEVKQYELDNEKVCIFYLDEEDDDSPYIEQAEDLLPYIKSKETMIKYHVSDKDLREGLKPSYYLDNLRGALDYDLLLLSKLKEHEYIIFINTEYVYPLLWIDDDKFEPGIKCSRIKVFKISDKRCLIDKRIFAVSPENIIVFDGKTDGKLSERTQYEMTLQCMEAGLPYKKRY